MSQTQCTITKESQRKSQKMSQGPASAGPIMTPKMSGLQPLRIATQFNPHTPHPGSPPHKQQGRNPLAPALAPPRLYRRFIALTAGSSSSGSALSPPVSYTHLDVYKRQAHSTRAELIYYCVTPQTRTRRKNRSRRLCFLVRRIGQKPTKPVILFERCV